MEYCCNEHVNYRFVGIQEFREMLTKVVERSRRYVDYIENVIFGDYVEGVCLMMDMLKLRE